MLLWRRIVGHRILIGEWETETAVGSVADSNEAVGVSIYYQRVSCSHLDSYAGQFFTLRMVRDSWKVSLYHSDGWSIYCSATYRNFYCWRMWVIVLWLLSIATDICVPVTSCSRHAHICHMVLQHSDIDPPECHIHCKPSMHCNTIMAHFFQKALCDRGTIRSDTHDRTVERVYSYVPSSYLPYDLNMIP